jgi:small neutral amino acid transporter SnatA (MarC family)
MTLSTDQIKVVAEAIATLIVIPTFATIVWAILTLIFGLSISWLQVLGGIIIIDLLKSLLFPKK